MIGLNGEGSVDLLRLAGFHSPSKDQLELAGFGTAFAINEDGYLITASHVTEGCDVIRVIMRNGRTLPAELIKDEPSIDLAILKIGEATTFFAYLQ